MLIRLSHLAADYPEISELDILEKRLRKQLPVIG